MLAGVGPVPAVLLVVAADEGWMPQSAEHVAALDALGVRHGLLVVTRSDLADPEPGAARRPRAGSRHLPGRAARRSRSARGPGPGLRELRAALADLVAALPGARRRTRRVRLWVDRAFTIRGSGTVVTGTLDAGTLRVGDELDAGRRRRPPAPGAGPGPAESLGEPQDAVRAVARVAVNLRGVEREAVRARRRPGHPRRAAAARTWSTSGSTCPATRISRTTRARAGVLHVGSAAVGVRVRPLGPDGPVPRPAARSTGRCRWRLGTWRCCATPAPTGSSPG